MLKQNRWKIYNRGQSARADVDSNQHICTFFHVFSFEGVQKDLSSRLPRKTRGQAGAADHKSGKCGEDRWEDTWVLLSSSSPASWSPCIMIFIISISISTIASKTRKRCQKITRNGNYQMMFYHCKIDISRQMTAHFKWAKRIGENRWISGVWPV